MKRVAPLRRFTPLRASRPKVGGDHGSRRSKRSYVGLAADTQPLVALEGQLLIPKPAPRRKAAPAGLQRSWIKKKRARRIDRETPREKVYKIWIHHQSCAAGGVPGHVCNGPIEQSHERSIAKGSGTGVKLNNFESWAFCWQAARDWDNNRGIFNRWPKTRRLKYSAERVIEANAMFEADYATRPAA